MRGRVRPLDKRSPTRAIQGIDGDLKLNRALRLFCVCCRLVIFTKDHELRHPFWALSRRRPKIEGPKMAKMATLKSQAPGQPTKKSAGSMVMV